MRGVEDTPLTCLDANVFLAVLIPEATRAAREEITGAERVLRAVEEGRLRGVSTTIVFGELRYVYLREGKPGFEIARAAIEAEPNLKAVAVSAPLSVHRETVSPAERDAPRSGLRVSAVKSLLVVAPLRCVHRGFHFLQLLYTEGVY